MIDFSHLSQVPSSSDWLHLSFLFIAIIVLIALAEFIRKKLQWRQEATRKFVHIAVGLLLLLMPILVETSLPLLIIAIFFTIFNFIALRQNLLPGIHIDRRNLGTVYYAFSFFILILLFWSGYKVIIIAAMMVMAVGDASAAIVGNTLKSPYKYRLIDDDKSIVGSITMFVVSALSIFLTLILYPPSIAISNHTYLVLFGFSVLTAIIATAAEALGHRGNDNLTVPLLSAIVLFFVINSSATEHYQFLIGMLLGGIVAYLSFKVKFITASGSFTTFILASVIFGFGGWLWTIPILTFFVFSSLLSKAGKSVKSQYELMFEKGNQRDHAQVLANGGIAGFLMSLHTLYPSPVLYLCYLGALASAMADTWATEIGVVFGKKPRLITNFKKVASGTSGGITLGGLIGALFGALILSLSGTIFYTNSFSLSFLNHFGVVGLAGFLGSIIDSYLGATLQVQYQCTQCGKITEKKMHCHDISTSKVSGISWINNDIVNLIATLSGGIFVLLMLKMFNPGLF